MIIVIIVDMEVKGIVKVMKGSGGYMTEKQLLEDIRYELASIDRWYAFEPTININLEKEGHTIVNNKDFLIQLEYDDLIKRIDKELSE